VPAIELNSLEKKESRKFALNARGKPDGDTVDELAKQVSAFSNARHGFLVYGITKQDTLDVGVPITIGAQSTKDWIEAQIPKLLTPAVIGCEAKIIRVVTRHAEDRGVLVVSIPLSESRPHWTEKDIAFIRAGAHSVPMAPQTLLDMATRTFASTAEIVSMNALPSPPPSASWHSITILPAVRLLTGTTRENWGFELETQTDVIQFNAPLPQWQLVSERKLFIPGTEPLLPGRTTPVSRSRFHMNVLTPIRGEPEFTATLFTGSPRPTVRKFRVLSDATIVEA
jgi:hypothetical protein